MPPTSKHDTVQTSDFAAPVVDRNQHMHNSDSVARRLRAAFLGTVLLAALSAPVESGAQGSVGFRSGFTEGNGIPPRGRVDVDYGGSAIDAGRMRAYTAGEVVAHIPLSRRAGLRLHVNSYAWVTTPQARATGREDIGVGSAFIVRSNAGWRPATALLTRIDLPSGSLPGVGNGWRPTRLSGRPNSRPSARTSSLKSSRSGSTSCMRMRAGKPPTLWCDLIVTDGPPVKDTLSITSG
jgi:hypothetical protein